MISLKRRVGGKTILAGVALLVFLALIYLFYTLNQSTRIYAEALDLKQRKLVKYRKKVLEKKVMEKSLLTFQNSLKRTEAGLLVGKTPPLAAAEIQERIGNIANAAGAEIKTVRILQPDRSEKAMYLAIPVEVTIQSTMRQLTELLYKLNRSTKLLRITKLGIKSRGGYKRRKGTRRQKGPVNIITTLTVEGFVKKVET